MENSKKSFTLSFDSGTTGKNVVNTRLEYQLDVGASVKTYSPNYILAARQALAKEGPTNKEFNSSVFDFVGVKEYHVEMDKNRYHKDSANINYAAMVYNDQCEDVNFFYEEYAKEPLLEPFITYGGLKNFYPIQVFDLKLQVIHLNPRKCN